LNREEKKVKSIVLKVVLQQHVHRELQGSIHTPTESPQHFEQHVMFHMCESHCRTSSKLVPFSVIGARIVLKVVRQTGCAKVQYSGGNTDGPNQSSDLVGDTFASSVRMTHCNACSEPNPTSIHLLVFARAVMMATMSLFGGWLECYNVAYLCALCTCNGTLRWLRGSREWHG
jgi:hypothetical protein